MLSKTDIKTDIEFHYKGFLTETKRQLEELIVSSDMTGDEKASILSSMLDSSQKNALLATKLPYEIENLQSSITLQNIQASLQSQKLATEVELAPLKIEAAQLDNAIKNHKVSVTLALSDQKIVADTNYVSTQSAQLVASVEYNNKIKTLNSLSDLFGTMGAGGLVVPSAGWSFVFDIAKTLSQTTLTVDTNSFQNEVARVAE